MDEFPGGFTPKRVVWPTWKEAKAFSTVFANQPIGALLRAPIGSLVYNQFFQQLTTLAMRGRVNSKRALPGTSGSAQFAIPFEIAALNNADVQYCD
jgi:hypothetical protein